MINRKGFYIHDRAMDVFVEIYHIYFIDDKRLRGKCNWWNIGYGSPYKILSGRQIEIKASDLMKWKHFNPDDSLKFRQKQLENQLVNDIS